MKKFKFKLNGLLKLRKLEEDQCKMQLSLLQKELNRALEKKEELKRNLDNAYDDAQGFMKEGGTKARYVQFLPYFSEAKRVHIEQVEEEIKGIEASIKNKYAELNICRGKLKLIDKIKDKEFVKFKKERNKQIELELEERYLMRKAYEQD